MAEQTFRSPGFFEREIDVSQRKQPPSGVPAIVISTSQMGPAFVPVTVGSFADFVTKFGTLDNKYLGPYAANEFLKNRTALTFCRVLGAGANSSLAEISHTVNTGKVKNAGFVVTGSAITSAAGDGQHVGSVVFLAAIHSASANEAFSLPMFSSNDSFTGTTPRMIRAMIFLASDTRMMVFGGTEVLTSSFHATYPDDVAQVVPSTGEFKLVISSSVGSKFSTGDGFAGLRVLTASLNPSSQSYIGNILNANPYAFATEKHLLYADFAVDDEAARVATDAPSVAIMSGSANTSDASGDTTMAFRNIFGHFDSRYTVASTPWFISQPFGAKEYDLFKVEALSDGAYSNDKFKISIANVRASTDTTDQYGTFSLIVRRFDDNDASPVILEQYDKLSLNPLAKNYVANVIGDKKVFFNFDDPNASERRLVIKGKYPNKSFYIRVVMDAGVDNATVPKKSLPFGFRGPELLKTTDYLHVTASVSPSDARMAMSSSAVGVQYWPALTSSILPPIPYRYKVTRGDVATTAGVWAGSPGVDEIASADFYWGTKFERNNSANGKDQNSVTEQNKLLSSLTKFMGIKKLDALLTGTLADGVNNNKFTLARVALYNASASHVTGSAEEHMLQAVYIRNATPNTHDYSVTDGVLARRVTLATLLALTSSVTFNKFVRYNKFSTFMYGGFDGVNILDQDAAKFADKAASIETNGGANSSFVSPGLATNVAGGGLANNAIASYRSAVEAMTDEFVTNGNLIVVPGVRDPFVTDYVADRTKRYGMAMYIMDIPTYDSNGTRIFDGETKKPSVEKTINQFEGRAIDNNYVATYFPDISIDDEINTRRVNVPASLAALAAMGFNDKIAYPWFAPAGFNRAALTFVKNAKSRLSSDDRNNLQDARINPIATFPRTGFVIFGQKTLQQAKSSLDRVNVRRLLLEVKRIISATARGIVFEQITPDLMKDFVGKATQQLSLIQIQQGIDLQKVVMDNSNNTSEDAANNRLNGRVTIVPTRTAEFVAVDFVITPEGVQFL